MKIRTARVLLGLQGIIWGGLSTVFLVSPETVNRTGGQLDATPTSTVRDLGLTKQFAAMLMLYIAARGSPKSLREVLLLSAPFKFLAMWIQINSGNQWVNVGLSDGVTGVLNAGCALLME